MNREKVEHIGDCHKCPAAGVPIAYGWSTRNGRHCRKCNGARLQSIKMEKARNRPRKPRIVREMALQQRKPVSNDPSESLRLLLAEDKRVNREIWAEREHRCHECSRWLPLNPPPKGYFSHVHSKGARADLRHVKENIVLHCYPRCHQKWETGDRESMPKTKELYDRLSVEFQDNKFQRK